jgi:monofunctional biosynthetic peptidoglycan transglycosylase
VVIYKFVPVPFTPLMVIRAIENSADKKENSFSHDWESIENISVNLQKAVIASEDGSFLFTTDLILRRCKKAYKGMRGRKIKGGSTIATNS